MKTVFLLCLSSFLLTLTAAAQTTIPSTTYPANSPPVVVSDSLAVTTGTSTVTVSSGAQVIYESGTSISLEPGFHAASGAQFDARVPTNLPPPVLLSAAATSVLAGQSVTFNATGGSGASISYTWSGAASGTGSTQTVTFNTAGTYTVTVTNNGVVPAQTTTLTINVYASGYTNPGLKVLTPAP